MHIPSNIVFQRRSNQLLVQYGELNFELDAEFLRVHSPSAEVKGHGPNQEILQHGKQGIRIVGVEPQGNYALKIIFSDGHDSGLFSWDYLYKLCHQKQALWEAYLDKLHKAGKTRDASAQVINILSTPKN